MDGRAPTTRGRAAGDGWRFRIDVGGTFTDCVAVDPAGGLRFLKVLSAGVAKGRVVEADRDGDEIRIRDPALARLPPGFHAGYAIRFEAGDGATAETRVARHEAGGWLALARESVEGDDLSAIRPGAAFELSSGEPAPILAIREALGIGLGEPIGRIELRLGTTRATNALLERTGARTALLTTRGFGDLLLVGNQDRPRLFDLAVRKPEPLHARTVEATERIASDGTVLVPLERREVREKLAELARDGFESVAICFLNAYRNDVHERVAEEEAAAFGFRRVSVSSRLSPTIKMVSRGDTTVADAYLTPAVRDYVESIARAIPDARSLLMSSAGALVAAERASGKDLVLSGPAGGVVGFAAAARAAGYGQAIGFDMGGTSTDVCRWDGDFDREYETTKAGVRIVAPMLAIETVAAGGGSVCDFDGAMATVGPRSAGADPGPACYGRGGPFALTDANLLLGRLPERFFPFALDRAAAERRLDAIADRVAEATGRRPARAELAEGFVRIANARMAGAIRRVSVARGFDPREFALVCFGGAGGQHACAIAEELGMRTVLIHPLAGVLSAYGMAFADGARTATRTIGAPLTRAGLEALEPLALRMAQDAGAELEADGFERAAIGPPKRTLELRYAGQNSTLDAEFGGDDDERTLRARFEARHREVFGHAHEGRAVEIAALRVERVAALAKPEPIPVAERRSGRPEPAYAADAIFGGRAERVPVFDRRTLARADRIAGPAVVADEAGTTVVDPGWTLRVERFGELILERAATTAQRGAGRSHGEPREGETTPDPVELEIFNRRFASIAERMGEALRRTALSVNVRERLDFSCGVFSPDGDLVANAPHVPVHLGAMGECVKSALSDFPDLRPGEIVVTNDPSRGGSHLPDVTVVSPVFDETGARRLFFVASRAHHAEIGGKRPGSMPPDSRNLAEEGVVLSNLRLPASGPDRVARLREAFASGPYPSRAPAENLADVEAQIAAGRAGERDLLDLVRREGADRVVEYMRLVREAAERKTRAAIARLPDGVRRFEDRMDDGSVVRVEIEVRGDRARVDFTGSAPVHPGNLNANRAIVASAVLYCFRCLVDEDIPLNAGVLAPIDLVVPEGMLNPPANDDPARRAAVVGGNVETSQRIADVVLGALGAAAASQGTMNNLTFGDETFGYYETICGGAGAGPGFDGADAVHTHMTNTRLTDPEVLEARYPVRVRRFAIRRGSGGAGARRGGDGVVRELEFLAPVEVSLLTQRRATRPFGLEGGEPGAPGRNTRIARDGSETELPPAASFRAEAGEAIRIETPGGGGCGRRTGPYSGFPFSGHRAKWTKWT